MKFTLEPAKRETGNIWHIFDKEITEKMISLNEKNDLVIKFPNCEKDNGTSKYNGELTISINEAHFLIAQLERHILSKLNQKQDKPFTILRRPVDMSKQ